MPRNNGNLADPQIQNCNNPKENRNAFWGSEMALTLGSERV